MDFARARQAMVDCQVRPADVTRYSIIESMLAVPRELFVPKARRDVAYAGCEIALGPDRVLLEPRTLAKMLEAAAIGPQDLVLDLAPGTGYSTAVIARMAEAVVAIEPDADLAETARSVLAQLEADNAVVLQGDPAAGDSAHGPFDVIFVNGCVERIPDALLTQLKAGGRLVALFADRGMSQCHVLTRSNSTVTRRYAFDADAPMLAEFRRKSEFAF